MLSFTFFDAGEWTQNNSVSKELYSKMETERNELVNEQIQDRGYIVSLETKVENQRKELNSLHKILKKEQTRNKELEELYSERQHDVAMLNMKVMELNQGIRDYKDLTWKQKYDALNEEMMALRYKTDSACTALQNRCRELMKINNDLHDNMIALEKENKELNQGIHDSADLTWKEKYEAVEKKYTEDSQGLRCQIDQLRKKLDHIYNRCDIAESKLDKAESKLDKIKGILDEE